MQGDPTSATTGGRFNHRVGTARRARPFVWEVSTAGSLAPPAWSSGMSATQGSTVVTMPAGTYGGQTLAAVFALCTTSGTAGTGAPGTAAGPNGLGDGIKDGTVVWTIIAEFANGLTVYTKSGTPLIGPQNNAVFPVGTLSGFDSFSDPTLVYLAGTTPDVLVWGSP